MNNSSPPLRIVTVIPVYCHPAWRGGGVARSSTDSAIGLARRGNHVTAISPLFDGDAKFPAPPENEVRLIEDRLRLLYVPAARPTRFGTSADGLRRVFVPELSRADVAHIHTFFSPWTDQACAMARAAGVPYVIQDHGKLTPSILNNRGLSKRLYLRFRGLALLRAAARVVPLASNIAEAIARMDARIRCDVCPNGVDPDEFEGDAGPRPIHEPYILFLGWLDPRKNLDMLVRSFANIRDLASQWKLALVGPDSYGYLDRLRPLIKTLGIEHRVLVTGPAKGLEKLAWLKHADLFVLPSEGEGLSMAMIEALACGVPCLLSPACNFPEIEDFGAGEIVPLKESKWSDACAAWMADEPRRRTASKAAFAVFRDRLTIDRVAGRLEEIMRKVVAGGTVRQSR